MRKLRRLQDQATYAVAPGLLFLLEAAGGDTVPTISPDKSQAPGAGGLNNAINGFAYYALLAAAAGFLLGGAVWAVGSRGGNDYAATGGKVGMATAVGVAFLIGGSTTILRFAFGAGGT